MTIIGLPAPLLLVGTIVVVGACAMLGQYFLHTRYPSVDFVGHNEVGGFIISVAGATYAVLLGFFTVVAWQHFSDTRAVVALEAATSADVWHNAVGLPAPQRGRIRRDMLDYANAMVRREWPAMRTGSVDAGADVLIMDAFDATGTLRPDGGGEAAAQTLTLTQLTALHDLRQRRLSDNVSVVSWFEWTTLAIGAVGVIVFCWLFGLENQRVHLLMTGIVTTIIASTLVLLFELQYPFRTDLRIDATDWQGVVAHIEMMDVGRQLPMRM